MNACLKAKAACEETGLPAVADDSGAVLKKWDEIKKQEKAGKEWTEAYLPAAFEEAKELIDAAAERKGFGKKERNDQSE